MSNNDYLRRGEPHEEAVDTSAQAVERWAREFEVLADDEAKMHWFHYHDVATIFRALSSQLEAARRNEARYLWLRKMRYDIATPSRGYLIDLYEGEALDAAIDAAIASAGGKA